jgi:hypothetical protein
MRERSLRDAIMPPPGAEDVDVFGAEAAALLLAERVEQLHARSAPDRDSRSQLSPPFALSRDRAEGSTSSRATLVVFGAFGASSSRRLGAVVARVRERDPVTVAVAWRHYLDPREQPRAALFALAAEAAAAQGRFWALARELLRLRRNDPVDLHQAMIRANLDPERTLAAMRSGTGADRIVDDVASARASGVVYAPTLFINGERYERELDGWAVIDALVTATS